MRTCRPEPSLTAAAAIPPPAAGMMAGLRLDSSALLAALLNRRLCPQKWAHLVVVELPEGQALMQAKFSEPGGRSRASIHRQRAKQVDMLEESWIAQLSTDAGSVVNDIG